MERFTINLEDECIDDAEEMIFIDFNDKIDFNQLCDLLNEQDRKIKVLQNSCEIMNQRLSSKCKYKKAIIEFCKFMNINSPLVEIMVDEFLQEVF